VRGASVRALVRSEQPGHCLSRGLGVPSAAVTIVRTELARPVSGIADRVTAVALFLVLTIVYASNGREIGSFDSRPTELAARQLLLRHTLTLNHDVGAVPEYASRWGFIQARDGTYRSIYSPVPSILAAAIMWPFWRSGLVDVRAPLAAQLIGKSTATLLVALAAVVCYVTAGYSLPRRKAVLLAIGLALGTGWWSAASQTLWQSESAVLGLALAVAGFVRLDDDPHGSRTRALLVCGLALALTSRSQLAPAIGVLLAGVWYRAPRLSAVIVTAGVAAAAAALTAYNVRCFGNVFGALPLVIELNRDVHGTAATFRPAVDGALGLLFSPSRGLLVFSPVVFVAFFGIRDAVRAGVRSPNAWCLLAAIVQYLLYSTYAVWWGGHTYGPRYLLDILPLLVPLAAAALRHPHAWPWHAAAVAALAWSTAVAATGAFVYPHEAWNTDPVDVDRYHERLWSIADSQIPRCWEAGASPQNFSLFDRAAVRRPAGAGP
jgi:hypothetical protein